MAVQADIDIIRPVMANPAVSVGIGRMANLSDQGSVCGAMGMMAFQALHLTGILSPVRGCSQSTGRMAFQTQPRIRSPEQSCRGPAMNLVTGDALPVRIRTVQYLVGFFLVLCVTLRADDGGLVFHQAAEFRRMGLVTAVAFSIGRGIMAVWAAGYLFLQLCVASIAQGGQRLDQQSLVLGHVRIVAGLTLISFNRRMNQLSFKFRSLVAIQACLGVYLDRGCAHQQD